PWQYWMVDGKNRQLGKTIDGVNHFYDGAGNLVRAGFQADGVSPVREWTYDALNMQQRYKRTFPDGTFQEYIYLYGPGDLRLMEFDGATGVRKMTYRDLGGSLLREYEVLGFGLYQPGNPGEVWTHKKDFLHGPLGLIATRTHGGGARFFFSDHLGSPRVLTNGLGTLTGKHHYYPYGTEYAPGQDDEQEYKYTGHQRDTHGLSDYMRGRTCAFPLQRFMSVDSGRDGWNLYAYTRGNPVNLVDPDGFDVKYASRSDERFIQKTAKKRPRLKAVLDAFAPGTGRDLFFEHGNPGTTAGGLDLAASTTVQFGREASSEAMIQAYEAAGGGEAGTAAADTIYEEAANDVTMATVTLGPNATKKDKLHELGHIEQALVSPEQFRQQAEEAQSATTAEEYNQTASELYAEEFVKDVQ
ncbi:MAG: RHS repeat-associated core domain-containing protein, partial [Acidobacteriota bacterium]|nr:RHS repeat-associated core domain-containing protein [Acidobacteriota bacterium]